MPTPAERKALLFLAGVIVLGAGVRVVRAARDDRPSDAASRQALARQLASVDSAQAGSAEHRATRGRGGASRRGNSRRPPRRSAADSTRVADSTSWWVREPLSDVSGGHTTRDTSAIPILPVDLDAASEADIESLPRIGPVLAKRIVEDRAKHGAFGSLEGFERVRGVGPALAASLRARVTFSGTARLSNAVVDSRLRSSPPSSKSHRRERKN